MLASLQVTRALCASWEIRKFGLIAPGTEMAEVPASDLTQAKAHKPRNFKRPDFSAKPGLSGVEVGGFWGSLCELGTGLGNHRLKGVEVRKVRV